MSTLTLPCRRNPAAWDITDGDRPKGGTKPWHVGVALAAVRICQTCPLRLECAARAVANPPMHRCVQGGLIFEMVGNLRTVPIAPRKWAAKFLPQPAPAPVEVPASAVACAFCDAPIANPRSTKKFCSQPCRRRDMDRKTLAKRTVRPCSTCGQDRGDTTKAKRQHALRHVNERRDQARRDGTYVTASWSKTIERVELTAQMVAAGATVHEVAARFGVDYQTAKRYLDRAREAA